MRQQKPDSVTEKLSYAGPALLSRPRLQIRFHPWITCAPYASQTIYALPDRYSQWFTSLDVSSLTSDGSGSLLLFDTSFSPSLPVSLHIGDIDLDGFPDLVPILVHKDGSRRPHALVSNACSPAANGCSSSSGRTFSVLSKGTRALEQITDARGVSFLDIDEDVSSHYILRLLCAAFDLDYCDRGRGISWYSGRENNLENMSASSRTIFSMMRFSSKR